jgi:hypothetical protein
MYCFSMATVVGRTRLIVTFVRALTVLLLIGKDEILANDRNKSELPA